MPRKGSAGPVVGILDATPDTYLAAVGELVPDSRLRLCRDPDGLGALADAEVLLAFKLPAGFPREEILALPRLRWLQLASAGADHILPFDASRVTVTSASGLHGDAMAEYVLALLVHMRWDVPRLMRQQAGHRWERYEVPTLSGLTMSVVGAGHVGSRIAARAQAFGMRTLGVRRSGGPVAGFDEVAGMDALARVLAQADVVVLALPLTRETRGMVGPAELAAIKSGAWLVNVSRGGIVQDAALVELLQRKRLAGAILDVFEEEPLPADSPFWDLPGVLVTPHIASEFAGWPAAVARLFCDNLRRYVSGETLVNVIDPVRGY